MHRVANIHVYESWGDVVLECRVRDFHMGPDTPLATATCHVQVPGTGDDHAFRWMLEALLQLCKASPGPDDGE